MRVEQFELLGDLIEVVAQGEHDGQIPRIEVALSEKFVVSLCSINLIIVLVMEPLIYIISIIWWILCIVLFFKVWGMCNDVRKIKNQIDRNDDYSTKIDFLLRIGEKEKAKEILINRILSNDTIFNSTSTPVEKIEEICQLYKDEFESLGIEVKKDE